MKKHQSGFTLVEMMISLLLGLSLIAGISELFQQSQKNYRLQRASSYMMQDGRYVLEVLSREIRRTGFLRNKDETGGKPNDVFYEDENVLDSIEISPIIDFEQGEYIHGEPRDEFAIRYQLFNDQDLGADSPNNSNSPCTQDVNLDPGEDPAIERHVVTVYFFVQNDPDDPNSVPVLYCRAKREIINEASGEPEFKKPADGISSLPLISNVEKLIVRYGIHEENNITDPTDDTYYYTEAEDITDWRKVIAVKLFVVLRSEEDNLLKNYATYRIEGVDYFAGDRRLYRVFATTITFRNQVGL